DESGLERLPLRSVDQERHVAQRPRPLGPRRVLVDAIEDAGIAQMPIGGGEAPADLVWTQSRQHCQQRLPMGPPASFAVQLFVEDARQRTIARQQRLDVPLPGRTLALASHAAIRHESDAAGRGSSDIRAQVLPRASRTIPAYGRDLGNAPSAEPALHTS